MPGASGRLFLCLSFGGTEPRNGSVWNWTTYLTEGGPTSCIGAAIYGIDLSRGQRLLSTTSGANVLRIGHTSHVCTSSRLWELHIKRRWTNMCPRRTAAIPRYFAPANNYRA